MMLHTIHHSISPDTTCPVCLDYLIPPHFGRRVLSMLFGSLLTMPTCKHVVHRVCMDFYANKNVSPRDSISDDVLRVSCPVCRAINYLPNLSVAHYTKHLGKVVNITRLAINLLNSMFNGIIGYTSVIFWKNKTYSTQYKIKFAISLLTARIISSIGLACTIPLRIHLYYKLLAMSHPSTATYASGIAARNLIILRGISDGKEPVVTDTIQQMITLCVPNSNASSELKERFLQLPSKQKYEIARKIQQRWTSLPSYHDPQVPLPTTQNLRDQLFLTFPIFAYSVSEDSSFCDHLMNRIMEELPELLPIISM